MVLQPVQNGNEAFPDNNRDAVANSEQPNDERPRHGVFIRPGQSPDMLSQNADSTPAQETQQQPKRDFRPKDSSFGSFFPRSGGRTFAPRSQQEKEQAAQIPQPVAPIVLGEPGMEKMQPQGKKTKRTATRTSRLNSRRTSTWLPTISMV